MAKIYFNTRDELIAIDMETIALIQANGNYAKVITMYGKEIMLTSGLSKVYNTLLNFDSNNSGIFIRLGRSLVINHSCLQRIDLQKKTLTLSFRGNEIRINVSKGLLKAYKEKISNNTNEDVDDINDINDVNLMTFG